MHNKTHGLVVTVFFFNDTATTEIYTLSLHDALPIYYNKKSQEEIITLVDDLKDPFPRGRLSIIEGPPGTGKTFLLRSIISKVPKADVVFIPPHLVPLLGDPPFVPILTSLSEESNGPTVLICEDADSILVTRNDNNMEAISSLLNLTSGILGDLTDVRVIATTNAESTEFDSALTRPGRLSSHIRIDPLFPDEARTALEALLGKRVDFNPKEQTSLASVYREARKHGWRPPSVEREEDNIEIEVPDIVLRTYGNFYEKTS